MHIRHRTINDFNRFGACAPWPRNPDGGHTMSLSHSHLARLLVASLLGLCATGASAQSFHIQCPMATPNPVPAFSLPNGVTIPGGQTKCQQISGGDGFATMGDGTQTYLFAFGPLSGLKDMAEGKPGTQFPEVFNTTSSSLVPGDPAASNGIVSGTWPGFPLPTNALSFNGAVGLATDADAVAAGLCTTPCLDGHVDTRQIMDVGVMNGNMPAPLMAIDEDDEFFLTLTNVGQVMRPDLFEQHTVHFHGYPNASAFYDGVPDASVAINIGGSFTYYYLAPDAGTYFWHCHITPPEHLQMGMVGQIYVRPRQNRVPVNSSLYSALQQQQSDVRTKCRSEEH